MVSESNGEHGAWPTRYPAVVMAGAVLAAEGVPVLLVGSAALWLVGEAISVRDVDVVVQPGEANLLRLHRALAGLAIRPAEAEQVIADIQRECRSAGVVPGKAARG